MATALVTVTNGLFNGNQKISRQLAVSMLLDGSAEVDWSQGDSPESVQAIRLTHRGYDDLVKVAVKRDTRIYRSSEAGAALKTVQREQVYAGTKQQNPDVRVILTLRKLRAGSFEDWEESDKFHRNRFNPDKIREPLFRTEQQAREAVAA